MKDLSKDEFNKVIECLPNRYREQIRKNQKMCEYYQKFDTEHDMLKVLEAAKNWEMKCEGDAMELMELQTLKERLKKFIDKDVYRADEPMLWPDHLLKIELQKILEGKD